MPNTIDEKQEAHIASLIVYVTDMNARLTQQIQAIEGLEIHAQGNGKLVVTLECHDSREIANNSDRISTMAGVVNVQLVYHEYIDPD